MATSFKKKTSRGRVLQIPGTKPSLHNNQLLVSTGIPSMDNVIGGGVAVGTVMLIEEDTFGSYARQLVKYFLAEGVVTGHALYLACADQDPSTMLQDLPHPIEDDKTDTSASDSQTQDESMKIAWRYQQLPKYKSTPASSKFGHYYDLTRAMDEQRVHGVSLYTFDASNQWIEEPTMRSHSNTIYDKLLTSIERTIADGGYSTTSTQQHKSILRLALHGLGSQLWGEECGSSVNEFSTGLPRFLYCLRALLRSAFAVCMVTIPTHVFQDEAFTRRIERLCDAVLALESFTGSDKETNPVFKDYHGLFHIRRLPRLNTLACHIPNTLDLAFKLRRKKLTIETLHLPPDLSVTASRSQEDPVSKSKPGSQSCQAGSGNSKLDF